MAPKKSVPNLSSTSNSKAGSPPSNRRASTAAGPESNRKKKGLSKTASSKAVAAPKEKEPAVPTVPEEPAPAAEIAEAPSTAPDASAGPSAAVPAPEEPVAAESVEVGTAPPAAAAAASSADAPAVEAVAAPPAASDDAAASSEAAEEVAAAPAPAEAAATAADDDVGGEGAAAAPPPATDEPLAAPPSEEPAAAADEAVAEASGPLTATEVVADLVDEVVVAIVEERAEAPAATTVATEEEEAKVPATETPASASAPAATDESETLPGAGDVVVDARKDTRRRGTVTVVAETGALAGKALPSAWVQSFQEEKVITFEIGEHAWMQNPYFKDGTKLRVGPNQEDEMLDQFVLNDDEVIILDQDLEKGFVKVQRYTGIEHEPEGWVRTRNVSKIERQSGLPDLGEIAQMAVDALHKSEDQVSELEATVHRQEDEIASLKMQLEELKKASPDWKPLAVGEKGFMLNPNFSDGTRLRSEPTNEENFNGQFVMNDAQVEILEINQDYLKIRSLAPPPAEEEGDAASSEAVPVEGWVRNRNVTRVQRQSGIMDLRKSFKATISQGSELEDAAKAATAAAAATDAAEPEAAATGSEATADAAETAAAGSPGDGEKKAGARFADSSAYDAAMKQKAIEELSGKLASWLKMALEASNTRIMQLYSDWDRGHKGFVDKNDFVRAVGHLGVQSTPEELGGVFDIWDGNKSGTLELNELDRVIRGGTKAKASGGKDDASSKAKEIQRALNERLQGKVSKKKGEKPAASPAPKKKGLSRANTEKTELEVEEYEETGDEPEGQWAASKWLNSLNISKSITKALKMPAASVKPAFDFVKGLSDEEVRSRLEEAHLEGLYEVLSEGLAQLKKQKVSGSAALNDKFQASGKFQMSYGSLSLFYGGLESLLGPPQMIKDPTDENSLPTLLFAMESEHCLQIDSEVPFKTPNGGNQEYLSKKEWEFVAKPNAGDGWEVRYEERQGLREARPEWCRKPIVLDGLDGLLKKMDEDCNKRLKAEGHSELIKEELVGGRLYTGPMYVKYNGVLRSKSKVPFLVDQAKALCKGNDYATSIHAINSCVIKLSKLTKAGNVWRGIKDAKLPKEFWVPNSDGVRGGIEYGFSSTTTEKEQAVSYAGAGGKAGDAMTIFEMRMGMVDRGADLAWLSQYPHEKEVLLPPLTGVEALNSDIEGNMLIIKSRFSLNLSAQTLEQVLSRRRKMLMDMAKGIELDLREALPESNVDLALKILQEALKYDAFSLPPEWYNNDDNFAAIMQKTLYLQRLLVSQIKRLEAAMSKTELNLKGWPERSQARIMLLCGWVKVRLAADKSDVSIDLRDSMLNEEEGVALAQLLSRVPRLTALDVRGNETLGEKGAEALCAFMKTQKVTSSVSIAHSLCGITPANSRLEIPKVMERYELTIVCAELENSVWAEGVSAAMGAKSKETSQLNRRGGSHQTGDTWQPLIWAAKENQLMVAQKLLDSGMHDVNKQESTLDKALSGYSPLHWAAQKGYEQMLKLMLERGAITTLKDKHGNVPKVLAEKKGFKDLVALLEAAEKSQAKAAKAKEGKKA